LHTYYIIPQIQLITGLCFITRHFNLYEYEWWTTENPLTHKNTSINSMENTPSSEANSHSANQEILHLLWNLKVHYHVHKGLPLGHVMWVMSPWHDTSLGCGWRRQPPDMKGSCEYTE
jgi:hypothetical protein